MKKSTLGILGFPWDGGATLGRPGSRFAPQAIREALQWFTNRIGDQKVYDVEKKRLVDLTKMELSDYDDIDIAAYSTEKTFQNAEDSVRELLNSGVFPLILGGDHSISYPMIKALHDQTEGKVGIIQLDAHLDLVDDSPVQGRFSQSSQMRRALELSRIEPENIVQIGVRGYNYPWYETYLKETGIVQITAAEVHQTKPNQVIERTLAACEGVEKIYLTFDIDVLDPAFAPGTGANEPGGLTPVQCLSILEGLYPHINAMDIAEVNPLYDHHGITSSLAARIVFDCYTALACRGN
ncbi:formiminoglutamase/agmatinase [Melghirimyces profundicolus]|uniref:Formiminoglutamase/agmatinase n=1 Tax=Melghirimyces profundicolus TaxID=1242148 RepID=A0A2T6C923_9BACL|nr:agmatinase [Melghirimyces profundicolus]PTX64791.1 formiminoglutamase/agmatinase [Melghirimyces profundicolus]